MTYRKIWFSVDANKVQEPCTLLQLLWNLYKLTDRKPSAILAARDNDASNMLFLVNRCNMDYFFDIWEQVGYEAVDVLADGECDHDQDMDQP